MIDTYNIIHKSHFTREPNICANAHEPIKTEPCVCLKVAHKVECLAAAADKP